jgi:S1-C subfamily serine protease
MHTLEILNLDRYQEPIRLGREHAPLRVAVRPFTGPREALFFFNALVARLGCSPAVEELRTDYSEGEDAAFLPDVVLSFEYRVQYRSSGWNFWINTPGVLVLAPGWNGFVYEAEIETRVLLHDAAGRQVSEETIPMSFDLRHADLDRSIFGGLLLFGGSAYDAVTFDDDLIGSFQAQVSETYSLHAANRVLDRVGTLRPVEHRSTGSCFAIDRNGTVLTAHHLVKDARAIHVLLPSGEWQLAEVTHALPAEDLAVLRLGRITRGFLPITPAGTARAGLPVFALAHPGQVAAGVQPELGDGEIRALVGKGPSSRLELDAPLSASFVGSPLLNEAGLVVGVVVDAASAGQPARAVSIDAARPALDSFFEGSGDTPRERGIRRARSALCFVEATR